ncbi:peptidase S28 [Neoconidiobolus thromboides FSU 785]|nr:peptidase S28 [Neoconidiobolus thromboides FSU 785]
MNPIYNLLFFLFPLFIHSNFLYFKYRDPSPTQLAHNSRLLNSVQQLWFNQSLSHNNSELESGYWSQRYFINDQYYRPGGPAFLFIGAEGELYGDYWTTNSILTTAAEQQGGIIYALEHRFYGESYPKQDLSLNSLKYLTSELAILDIVNFVKNISEKNKNTQWILHGASYAGNLAAWAKYKYPDTFHGAIASSAALEAKIDFFEYDLMVQKALLTHGGQSCLNYHLENFEFINNILLNGSIEEKYELKKRFTCETVKDDEFGLAFLYLSALVQYNEKNNLKNYCNSLMLNGTSKEKFEDFIRDFKLRLNNKKCGEDFNYLKYNSIEKPNRGDAFRQWMYQCCTEFGYWQTAPLNQLPVRSKLLTINFNMEFYCKNTFGINNNLILNVTKTNLNYNSKNIKVNNLLLVNGQLDPWSSLSIINSTYDSMKIINVINGSHSMDIYKPDSNDQLEVVDAKQKILQFINQILK